MDTLEIKLNFHKLIDSINNQDMLSAFYEMMSNANDKKEGALWSKLTNEEQDELVQSVKESYLSEQLISQSEMKAKHKKWL